MQITPDTQSSGNKALLCSGIKREGHDLNEDVRPRLRLRTPAKEQTRKWLWSWNHWKEPSSQDRKQELRENPPTPERKNKVWIHLILCLKHLFATVKTMGTSLSRLALLSRAAACPGLHWASVYSSLVLLQSKSRVGDGSENTKECILLRIWTNNGKKPFALIPCL